MTLMQIRSKRKADAFLKSVGKKQKRAQADAEFGEGTGKRLDRMEKEIAAQGKIIAGLAVTVGKLWKFKMEQEGKE